jgi:hypothetical protein
VVAVVVAETLQEFHQAPAVLEAVAAMVTLAAALEHLAKDFEAEICTQGLALVCLQEPVAVEQAL